MLIPSLPAALFHQPDAKVPGLGEALASFTVLPVKIRPEQMQSSLFCAVQQGRMPWWKQTFGSKFSSDPEGCSVALTGHWEIFLQTEHH